ncbi:MAG: response regulator [Methermicoccaceae archaeon]
MRAKILITDDNELLRDAIKDVLSEFDVIEAESGERAVELFSKHNPDMVLMDIHMGDMDGIEATKRIVEMAPDATVVGISVFSSTQGGDMLKAGAKEVLSKPIKFAQLIAAVEKYLKKT